MIFGVVKITTATKVSRTVTPRGKKKKIVEADVTENIHPGVTVCVLNLKRHILRNEKRHICHLVWSR